MKFLGVALSTCLHLSLRLVFNYIFYNLDPELKRTNVPISDPDCWKGLKDMAKLGWNTFILKVMGWWAFDVFTQLAAMLLVTDVAAQTILRNIGLFTYMIPVGLASSMNFFTGKYIGKGSVYLAKKVSKLCTMLAFIWSFLSMTIVFGG